jgi:CheY-like chemotaxis protein
MLPCSTHLCGWSTTVKRPSEVLVADDQYVCRLVLGKMLEKDGHRVTMAENGAQCVALCASGAFDYVFLDYFMPELNGLEAAEQIRSIAKQKNLNTKIYLTSASDPKHLVALGLPTQAFHGVITKPINRDDVLSLLAPAT